MEENTTVKKKSPGRPALIECITLRRIGLADRTSDIGETVKLDREVARKLQDAGAIKVVI